MFKSNTKTTANKLTDIAYRKISLGIKYIYIHVSLIAVNINKTRKSISKSNKTLVLNSHFITLIKR